MAEEIVIKTVLDLSGSEQQMGRQVAKALNSPDVQAAAKNAGRKMGESLSLGIETGRNRSSAEARERAHQQRLEAIHLQSGARLQQIEARSQAQLGAIRERAYQQEQARLKRLESQAQQSARNIGDTMTRLGTRLTLGVSAPLIALGVAAVKTATDFDSLKRGLVSVSGSSAEAEKQLVRLKEVAKLPGLGFREAIQGSINLQAAGFSAERAERSLKAFGNALATVGKGKAELDGVILALSQIESKGKVSAEEINQLAERVPQIRKAMIAAFGTADTEVIQKAKITSAKFIDGVVRELEKLPKVTGGARNTFENLKDSIEQSLLPLGNKLLETILPAIERLTPKVLGLLEGFGKLSSGTQDLVIGFGAAAIAAGPFINAIGNLTKAVTALNAASATGLMARLMRGPVILAAAVVGTTAVQTFREATGAQEMIDRIGGPDQDRIARIMKQRGLSGADAWMRVAQELKDQALIAGLPKPEIKPETSAFEVFKSLGAGRMVFNPATNRFEAPGSSGGKPRRDRFVDQLAGARSADAPHLTLAQRQAAIDANMTEVFRALARDSGATEERLGRSTRATLTQDFEAREQAFAANLAELQRTSRRDLTRSGRFIDDAVNRGRLTPEQAEAASLAANREYANQLRGILALEQERGKLTEARKDDLQDEIELYDRLGTAISNTERFMRGFNSATQTVGDAFERFGANVSRALTSTKDLLDNLKQAVLQFFNDLLARSLQNAVRSVLAPIFGGGSGGGGGGGGGIGGIFGNIFRTPSTFPAGGGGGGGGGGGNAFQSIANAIGGGGGGIEAPASISSQIARGFSNFGNPFAPRQGATGIFANGQFGAGLAGGGGGGIGKIPGLDKILTGIFNNVFAGGAVSAFPPLLGATLGAGLGGQSTAGRILGAIGGGAVGLGVAFGSAVFSAGGGLAAASLAALGPAALIGAPLIIGAILLGKAAQRRKDEEASGQMLGQALDSINQLKASISSDQIAGSQARPIFDQILNTFKQQIGTLKTASVRKSRLTNQVRDLENIYQKDVVPLIQAQEKRRADQARFAAIDERLVPQFAGGGTVPGIDRGRDSVLGMLRPGEKVLTLGQQASVMAQSNPGVFERAGVPRAGIPIGPAQAFQFGGTAQPASFGPSRLSLYVHVGLTRKEVQEMIAFALDDKTGQDIIIDKVQRGRERGRNV